ncbi:quinoprotein dehydrogenase-associated SoxYZ-like carrier [Rubellimicrobium aerolatum]|uniref:Quinoprotein dehydrogenase-associated SoxYZ-like carrier n=1 Tax=Rubellimicrobium aerolatum TaxID=490979 RepID=A0ABW0SGJ7_9RHOB|nr:quinoprotein dehydrogenase-associated SoxYZ-like carrier [Rubellimicrobium aerolatum]MBP1807430.1 sulfur-oxidizing protein SoxY [Rubellimicrobium aerolatum]
MTRLLLALLLAAGTAGAQGTPLQPSPTWNDLAYDILGDAAPIPADGALTLEAPIRAEDAATVPIRLVQPPGSPWVQDITLVIDENPAPVAAEIVFGEAMRPLDFEMRVRVNQYSNVRALAMTAGGDLLMTGAFVKASGGCSAPASRPPGEAMAGAGEMRLREFGAAPDGRREAQVMIRHPQFSGLQRDQVTQLWIPAHFIDEMEVWQGDERLFALSGGISVSENPVFRFRYIDNGASGFRVKVHDTEGNTWEQTLPKEPAT